MNEREALRRAAVMEGERRTAAEAAEMQRERARAAASGAEAAA